MPRLVKRRSHKAGLPPASLVPVGDVEAKPTRITLIDYEEDIFREKEIAEISEILPFKEEPSVTWVNVDGLRNIEVLESIGKIFGLHPLVLEDIVSLDQRPKLVDFGDHVFLVLRMITYDREKRDIVSEQVSIILGDSFVLSFQQVVGDVFDPIRDRIRGAKGRIRKMGADYLAYALIDMIVDNYFVLLENLGDSIEAVEEKVVANPGPEILKVSSDSKRDLIFLRKSVWPLREVISALERGESPLVKETTTIYLRDVYDHTIQVMDTVETLRDTVSGMLEIYLSVVSNRMNEVMKMLTIIATIFIPLTFIAGIYGMNFANMPELAWRWGYPLVLVVMLGLGITMSMYFRLKGWL